MLYKLHQSTRILSKKPNIFSVVLNALAVIGSSRSVVGCYRMSTSNYKNHKTLSDFGYAFNDAGELRNIQSGDKFTYVDQEHYEALGEVITDEVYKILEDRAGLVKHYLDQDKNSFVFVSPDYESKDSLLCLIHGSGVVRAGQWARKLIINNSLDQGTQISYIKDAINLGLGVVVFNTNQNHIVDQDNVLREITGSSTPEEHASTVWKQLISPAQATNIIIVAHSYGGVVNIALAESEKQEFLTRVKGIYLTDSVHYSGLTKSAELNKRLREISKNYVTSDKPVGQLLSDKDIPRYSAGHKTHAWTSWSSQHTIFQQIKTLLNLDNQNSSNSNPKSEL